MLAADEIPYAEIALLIAAIPLSAMMVAWGAGILRLIWLNLDVAFTQHRPFDPDTRFAAKNGARYAAIIALLGLIAGPLGYPLVFVGAFIVLIGIFSFVRWFFPNWQPPYERRKQRRMAAEEEATRRQEEDTKRIHQEQRVAEELREKERLQLRTQRTDDERKCRMNARFSCESLYDRLRQELSDKFSEERLAEYIEKYLRDDQPVEEVEERAVQLKTMLQELATRDGDDTPRFQSLAEIREFYHQERLRVDDSQMDDDLKDTVLADLARDEELAIREFRMR